MAQNFGLTQTVSEPTRGNNILDLFFTNTNSLTDKSEVVSGISDHEAVIVTNSLQLRHQKQPRRKVFLWNRANIPQMKTAANDFCNDFTAKYGQADANLNVNEMWSMIKSNLINILETYVPSKLTSSNSLPPWITQETKRLIRNKQSWYQKAKERNDDHSWQKYKDYKRETQKQCRRSHDAYVQNLITDDRSNKKFWTYIKSQRKEKTGIADIFDRNTWVTDPKPKANLFNAQ